jgi:enamine deaminase RidA (YjgF/YER057c/UK114 family)
MKKLFLIICLFIVVKSFAQTPEEKLAAAGIILPNISAPVANYVNVVRTGNLLFLSGKGPSDPSGKYITGKLGNSLTIEEGYSAARLTAINQLAVLKKELGELSKIKRIVKSIGAS